MGRSSTALRLRRLVPLFAVGLVGMWSLATPSAAASACASRSIPTADLPSAIVLNGVSALSSTNAWAVGVSGSGQTTRTLVEHWNGRHWSHVASPGVLTSAGGRIELNAVSARAPGDVWAVGERNRTGVEPNGGATIIEHWNGSSWRLVPAPNPPGGDALDGVVSLTADDAWAVGHHTSTVDGTVVSLLEHWDGHGWSVVHGVNVPGELDGMSASGPGNVWAVGWRFTSGADETLAEHYDGHTWEQVTVPSPGGGASLDAVSIRSGTSGWAVGQGTTTFTERYDGSGWKVVKAEGVVNPYGVADVSQKLAWIVGATAKGAPAIARWNGSRWSPQQNPPGIHGSAPGFLADPFMSVTRISATAAIAVGWIWEDSFNHVFPPIAARVC